MHLLWPGSARSGARFSCGTCLSPSAYLSDLRFSSADVLRVLFFPQDMVPLRYVAGRRCFLFLWRQQVYCALLDYPLGDFCEPRGVSNLAEMTLGICNFTTRASRSGFSAAVAARLSAGRNTAVPVLAAELLTLSGCAAVPGCTREK